MMTVRAEELQFKTDTLQEYVMDQAKQQILAKAAIEGVEELDEEELEQMTMEQVQDELDSYTSIAEKWANHILTCQKAEFNLKEKSEDAFRDMLFLLENFTIYMKTTRNLVSTSKWLTQRTLGFLLLLIESGFQILQGELREPMLLVQYKLWSYRRSLRAIPDLTKERLITYEVHSKTMD